MPVKGYYDVEINGVKYVCDLDVDENRYLKKWYEETFKPAQDTSTKRGEHSLSDWWFEKQTDWSKGEDQTWWDSPWADESRFKDSLNIDNSEPGEVKLLKATTQVTANAVLYLPLMVAGGKLWAGVGAQVGYSSDGTNFTGVTVSAGKVVRALECDGDRLYAALDGANTVFKSGQAVTGTVTSFGTWSTTTGVTDMKFMPAAGTNEGLMYGLAGRKFVRFASDGTDGWTYTFSTGWTLVGIDSYQGNSIIFGGGFNGKYFLFKYDGSGVYEVGELPPGFVLTGLKTIDPDTVLVMGYEDVTASGGGLGSVWIFKAGEFFFLGNIGSDTANRLYGPYVAHRWQNDVMIGWNHQSGLYRYSMESGGLTKWVNTTSVNDKVKGIAFFKGKWYFSVENQGVYTEAATYSTSGWVEGSTTSFNVSKSLVMKEGVVEGKVWDTLTVDQSNTTSSVDANVFDGTGTTSVIWEQLFTAGVSKPLVTVRLKLKNHATLPALGIITLLLINPSNGATLATATVQASELGSGYSVVEFRFETPYTMTATTVYSLTLHTAAQGERIWWQRDTSDDNYTGGTAWKSTSGLGAGDPQNVDMYFECYYADPGTIKLDLSTNEGETFVNYGSSTDAATREHSFSMLNVNFDLCKYKLTLQPNGGATSSPVVKAVSLYAMPKLSTTRRWEFFVRADNDAEKRMQDANAYTLESNIETAYELKKVVAFKDKYFDKTSTVYNVIIEHAEIVTVEKDEDNKLYSSIIFVRLREAS